MEKPIAAIYENGVFRPLTPVDLPDLTPAVVMPQSAAGAGEGIRQSAGSWADSDAELDQWLDKLSAMRRRDRGLLRGDEHAK
jgi:predicted DNA-binding antitoxin AbrB/MazE fold protein